MFINKNKNLNLGIKNNKLFNNENNSLLDGFQDCYAYEVIRLIQTRPLFLDLHYDRLIKTCKSLDISPPKKEKIESDIVLLILENQIQNINIKIAVDQNNYAIFPIPSKYPDPHEYLRGVSCSLLFEERENPEIKAFQSGLRKKANEQISQQDIYESVLVNKEGFITEGSRSNLFFIQGHHLITATDHLVLAGITRLKVIEMCKELNYSIIFSPVSIDKLSSIDAAFICGTSPGVLPISHIERIKFDVQNTILNKVHISYHTKYLSYE